MYALRKEVVGKRFLCVKEKNSQRPNSRSSRVSNPLDYPWQNGIIRASNEQDCSNKDLKVLVEYDGQAWETREWLSVYDGRWKIFLVEKTMVWAQRPDPTNPNRPMLWPALAFFPLVDKHDLNEENFPVAVEFLGDHHLAFVSNSEIRPYQDDNGLQPALRNNTKVMEELMNWQRLQKSQTILLEGSFTLTGHRVRVYRQQFRQWFSAVITAHNLLSRDLSVMDDTVLQTHSVNPMLVQVILLATDTELDSLQRGEIIKVLPVRQHRHSKVIISNPLTTPTASVPTNSMPGGCNLFVPLTQGHSNNEIATLHYSSQQGSYNTSAVVNGTYGQKKATPTSACPDKAASKENRLETKPQQACPQSRLAAQTSLCGSGNNQGGIDGEAIRKHSVADTYLSYASNQSNYIKSLSPAPVASQKVAPKSRRKSDSSRRRSSTNQKTKKSAADPEDTSLDTKPQTSLPPGSAAAAMAALAAPHRTTSRAPGYVMNTSSPPETHRSPPKPSNSLGSPLGSPPQGYMSKLSPRRQQTPVTSSPSNSPYKSPPISAAVSSPLMSSPFKQPGVSESSSVSSQSCHLGQYSHVPCSRNNMNTSQLYALQVQQQRRLMEQQQLEYLERLRHENMRSLLSQYQTYYYQMQLMVQQREVMQQTPLTPEQQQLVADAYNQLLYQYQFTQLVQQLAAHPRQGLQYSSVSERDDILPDSIRQRILSAQERQQEELRLLAPKLEEEHLQTLFNAMREKEMTSQQIEELCGQLMRIQNLRKQQQEKQMRKEQQEKWEQENQEARLNEFLRQNQEQVQKLIQMPTSTSNLQSAEKQTKLLEPKSSKSSTTTASNSKPALSPTSSFVSPNSTPLATAGILAPDFRKTKLRSPPSGSISLGTGQTLSDENLAQLLKMKKKQSNERKVSTVSCPPVTSESNFSFSHWSNEQQTEEQRTLQPVSSPESTAVDHQNVIKTEKFQETAVDSCKDVPNKENNTLETQPQDVPTPEKPRGKKAAVSTGKRGKAGKTDTTAPLTSAVPRLSHSLFSDLFALTDKESFRPSELSSTGARVPDGVPFGLTDSEASEAAPLTAVPTKDRKVKSKSGKKHVATVKESSEMGSVCVGKRVDSRPARSDGGYAQTQVELNAGTNSSLTSELFRSPMGHEGRPLKEPLCNDEAFFDTSLPIMKIYEEKDVSVKSLSAKDAQDSAINPEMPSACASKAISTKSKNDKKRCRGSKRKTSKSEERAYPGKSADERVDGGVPLSGAPFDLTAVQKSGLTAVQKSDLTAVQKSDMFGVQNSDLAVLEKSDVTALQKSDLTAVQKSDVTALQKSDVTAVQKSDMSTLQKSNLSALGESDGTIVEEFEMAALKKSKKSKDSSKRGSSTSKDKKKKKKEKKGASDEPSEQVADVALVEYSEVSQSNVAVEGTSTSSKKRKTTGSKDRKRVKRESKANTVLFKENVDVLSQTTAVKEQSQEVAGTIEGTITQSDFPNGTESTVLSCEMTALNSEESVAGSGEEVPQETGNASPAENGVGLACEDIRDTAACLKTTDTAVSNSDCSKMSKGELSNDISAVIAEDCTDTSESKITENFVAQNGNTEDCESRTLTMHDSDTVLPYEEIWKNASAQENAAIAAANGNLLYADATRNVDLDMRRAQMFNEAMKKFIPLLKAPDSGKGRVKIDRRPFSERSVRNGLPSKKLESRSRRTASEDSTEGLDTLQPVSFVADQAVEDVMIATSPPPIALDTEKFAGFSPLTEDFKASRRNAASRQGRTIKGELEENEINAPSLDSSPTIKLEEIKQEDSPAEEYRRKRPKRSRNRKRKGEDDEMWSNKKVKNAKDVDFFIQEGCCTTLPKLPKCRECRDVAEGVTPGIDCCRFNLFRRLKRLRNGTVVAAGFLLPDNATPEEFKPWVARNHSTMGLQNSMYILQNVGKEFCNVVQTEMKAISSAGNGNVAYKRAVQGLREMCDACATTIFNVHWVCEKCGFGVCLDCYELRVKERKIQPEGSKRVFQFKWMSCGPGVCHQPKNLTVAQIIPQTLLSDLEKEMHRTQAKLGIEGDYPCKWSKSTKRRTDRLLAIETDSPTLDKDPPKSTNGTNGADSKSTDPQDAPVTSSVEKRPAPTGEESITSKEATSTKTQTYVNLRCEEHLPIGMEIEWLNEDKRWPNNSSKTTFASWTSRKEPASVPAECDNSNVSNGLSLLTEYNSSTESTPQGSPGVVMATPINAPVWDDLDLGLNLLAAAVSMTVKEETVREVTENSDREEATTPVATVAEATSSQSTMGEDFRSSPDLLAPRITEECPAPHTWFCDGRLLRLLDNRHSGNLKAFESRWKMGEPVLVSGVDNYLNLNLWTPEAFGEEFGSEFSDVVNCRTGVVIKDFQIGAFWKGFESIKDRPVDQHGDHALLKLKDWPPSTDFSEKLPRRFHDLMNNAPLPEYTRRDGCRNLASRMPEFFATPDLGPKMYNAYGSAACPKEGTTNLHLDMSDAVNVMVYVGVPKDEGAGERERADAIAATDLACDEAQRQRVRDPATRIGALWHIFAAEDADKIRALLHEVAKERKMKYPAHHDPIHDQCFYLDHDIRKRLKEEYGVEGWSICQCLGDAVFIPAGAPHQVRNLHSCVKVAEDFVSPEHISHCCQMTQEFRYLSTKHTNHEDKLQVKNIIYHAVKDAVHELKGHLQETTANDETKEISQTKIPQDAS